MGKNENGRRSATALTVLTVLVTALAMLSPAPARAAAAPTCSGGGGGGGLLGGLLGGLFGGLSEGACMLNALKYEVHTVTVDSTGKTIERVQKATIGLPNHVNVDGKGGSDVVATIAASGGLQTLTITLKRAPGSTGTLPALVEVVAADPTGASGAERIAFGYDQRTSTVPDQYQAVVDIKSLVDDENRKVAMELNQVNPGPTTDVIASTFDGPLTERDPQLAAQIHFPQSPTKIGLSYLMTEPGRLELSTNKPGRASGEIAYAGGTQDYDFAFDVQDIPSKLALDVGFLPPSVRYTGEHADGKPAAIGHLDFSVTSDKPIFGRATQMRTAIDGLPSNTEVVADLVNGDFGLTASKQIESVEIYAGSRAERAGDLPANGRQGLIFDDRAGQPFAVGARVHGLQKVSARLGEAIVLDVVMGGGPFDVAARLDGMDIDGSVEDLPKRAVVSLLLDKGKFTYNGSDSIGRLHVSVDAAEPLFLTASHVDVNLEQLPTGATLTADLVEGEFSLYTNVGVGLVELGLRSDGATPDLGALNGGKSGVVLHDDPDEFYAFARVRGLREMRVDTDPLRLRAQFQSSQLFVVDAFLGYADETPDISAKVTIDKLPEGLDVSLGDDGSGGSAVRYRAKSPIDSLVVEAEGVEFMEHTDAIKAAMSGLPTALDLTLPAEGGPMAVIEANQPVGQLRLAVGQGADDVELPVRSIGSDVVLNDLFEFVNLPTRGDEPARAAAVIRISALKFLSASVEPAINFTLRQDAASTRPVDIDAQVVLSDDPDSEPDPDAPVTEVKATLDKPGAKTSMSAIMEKEQPTLLKLDNSDSLKQFKLFAAGITGLKSFDATFDDLPPQFTFCMHQGGGCRRHNPNPILVSGGSGNVDFGRPYPAEFSLDLEDHASRPPGRWTTMNATIEPTDRAPVTLENVRFENLSMDLGKKGSFKGMCTLGSLVGPVPKNYVFIDSRNRPFVINKLKAQPDLKLLRFGTDSKPAKAGTRIAWLRGCENAISTKFDSYSRGTMNCGGARAMQSDAGDALDYPGPADWQILPVCQ